MNIASWIAVAGAVIAAAGAWFSLLQAGQAKRSAAAAERQASAAEEQIDLMRQQLVDERAGRHQAAGPHFAITSAVIEDEWHGQHVARITVEQDRGAAVSEVQIRARHNDYVHGLIAGDGDYTARTITWHDSAPGASNVLTASLEYNYVEPVNVVLDFTAVQAGSGNTWQQTLTAVPRRPEPEPRRGGRARRYE